MWVVSMWVAGTTTTQVTTIGLGTGDHGSTADAITTVIDATEEVLAESLGALVAAGQVAAVGPVAAVVADDCPTQG